MRMWKTNLIAIVILLSCGSLSADLNSFFCGGCGYFDGFYVGASGGVAINHAETEVDTAGNVLYFFQQGIILPQKLVNKRDNNIYEIRPWGEVFTGWGKQCSCFYWGGRFGINFSNFDPKAESSAISDVALLDEGGLDFISFNAKLLLDDCLKKKMRTVEYTLDFKPGMVFCDRTMVFGIIGAAFNRVQLKGKSTFNLEGEVVDIVEPEPFSLFNEISVDKKKTSAGFRGGLGIEHMLNRCLSFQLSYVYTQYWRLSESDEFTFFSGGEVTPPPIITASHDASFSTKASKHVVSIGLAYYF